MIFLFLPFHLRELFLNLVWDEVNKGLLYERLLLDLCEITFGCTFDSQEPSEFIPDYMIYHDIPDKPQSQCIYVANY